ncbi:UbiA-like polyprenyltransferase [Taibaiella koreensis]|uniref:UbiA-like polyprenyltransferase n=1 Tax=Taibaiella koreensis TaxID=1268548 RepID=UPI001F0962BF|nr:UbiA-like polyprenyltransferase [Taibaiella koreensis]
MSNIQAMPRQASVIGKYLSLVKFSHTVFALPFALLGFTLAVAYERQTFHWYLLVFMLLCMVFARSAAMAFNRFLDRRFDALNPRTAQREIPAGVIAPRQALIFTIVNCLLFVATTWWINKICFMLSPVALFVILFYSYTKRFTALCHLVLGAGLALAPIGAYLAVTGYFSLLPLLFSFTVFTWVSGFDIIYALQDEDFDRGQKLHSIPAALGKRKALWVSNLLHVFSGLFVIAAGMLGQFGILYWIGVTVFCGLLVYQHLLVKPNDLSKVNMAFANTNGIASILFAVFTILELLL